MNPHFTAILIGYDDRPVRRTDALGGCAALPQGTGASRRRSREKTQETGFIINAFHEVTKQLKEKEKELQRLKALAEQHAENVESYNENILQCVTSGVMTFDRNCRLTTMNRAAEELLGWEQDRKGMSCAELFADGEIAKAVHRTLDRKKCRRPGWKRCCSGRPGRSCGWGSTPPS